MPTTERTTPGAPRRRPRTGASRAAHDPQGSRYAALAVVVVLLAGLVGAGWWAMTTARDWVSGFGASVCQATAGTYQGSLDAEAMNNAALITAVAQRRGLPPRAATVALATAMQESKLHNIEHGDRDSLGLFQQRPSQGWGTPEQILDPLYSTNAFFDQLVKVKGWQTGEITKVAQAVQRSGFPEAYAQHEPEARAIASNLTGQTQGGLGCRLDALGPRDSKASAAAVAKDLTAELGTPAAAQRVNGDTLTVTTSSPQGAWAVGAWAVAKAAEHGLSSVVVGSREWTRGPGTEAWAWHDAKAPAASPTTVTIR